MTRTLTAGLALATTIFLQDPGWARDGGSHGGGGGGASFHGGGATMSRSAPAPAVRMGGGNFSSAGRMSVAPRASYSAPSRSYYSVPSSGYSRYSGGYSGGYSRYSSPSISPQYSTANRNVVRVPSMYSGSAVRTPTTASRSTANFNRTGNGRVSPNVAFGGHSASGFDRNRGANGFRSHAPFSVSRDWDRRRDHVWNNHRFRWFNNDWVIFDGGYPYYGGYGYGYGYPYYSSTYYDDSAPYYYADTDTVAPAPAVNTDNPTVDVQRELSRRGYDPGGVDGVLGPQTEEAIIEFQRDNGMRQTGRIDSSLLRALNLD